MIKQLEHDDPENPFGMSKKALKQLESMRDFILDSEDSQRQSKQKMKKYVR